MTTALSLWLRKAETRDRIRHALGSTFDADFFIEQMLIALQHPSLDLCTDTSKVQTLHACAALKLLPGMQHVLLVPTRNDDTGTTECTAIPQWPGLAALIARHPHVECVAHSLVHPDDDFEFDGTTQSVVRHDYDPFAEDRVFRSMEDVRGGYITAFFHDDRVPLYHIVKRSTLQAAAAHDGRQPEFEGQGATSHLFEQQCIAALYQDVLSCRAVPIDPHLDPQQLQAAMAPQDDALRHTSTVNSQDTPDHAPDRNGASVNGTSHHACRNGTTNGSAVKFAAANRTATLASRLDAIRPEPDSTDRDLSDSDPVEDPTSADGTRTGEALTGSIPADTSMPTPGDADELFATFRKTVLTSANLTELKATSEQIEVHSGQLTAEQLHELKDLVNSVADALTD